MKVKEAKLEKLNSEDPNKNSSSNAQGFKFHIAHIDVSEVRPSRLLDVLYNLIESYYPEHLDKMDSGFLMRATGKLAVKEALTRNIIQIQKADLDKGEHQFVDENHKHFIPAVKSMELFYEDDSDYSVFLRDLKTEIRSLTIHISHTAEGKSDVFYDNFVKQIEMIT